MPREKAVDVRLFAKIEVLGKQLDQTQSDVNIGICTLLSLAVS